MGIKRHTPEEIVTKLRQVEVLVGHALTFKLDQSVGAGQTPKRSNKTL